MLKYKNKNAVYCNRKDESVVLPAITKQQFDDFEKVLKEKYKRIPDFMTVKREADIFRSANGIAS